MPILPARRQETPQTIAPQRFTFPGFPDPYWSAQGAALYLGDVRACLRRLPEQSVHCCVTSPPYWGLRDYGTGQWEGGSVECDHKRHGTDAPKDPTSTLSGRANNQNHEREPWAKGVCGKCGAKRVDMQIGVEPSPDCGTGAQAQCGGCFVCSIVGVMREVQRVLRDDGTCWLNLGDTFDNGQQMIPARVAIALSGDGWKLVQGIIWYSPNKMPESVTNRCTKSHEHIFLLAKSQDYYYDAVAIQEPAKSKPHAPGWVTAHEDRQDRSSKNVEDSNGRVWGTTVVNKRDVWVVPTQGYPGAHFAVYSPRLITPCILAGTSEHGCCAQCGRPWERVVAKVGAVVGDDVAHPRRLQVVDELRDRSFEWSRNGKPGTNSTLDGTPATRETLGWRKVCGCQTDAVVPAVVLDPFVGSGTTVATAIQLGRAGVGIDLSETYLRENAIPRIEAALAGDKAKRVTVPMRQGAVPVVRKLRGVE